MKRPLVSRLCLLLFSLTFLISLRSQSANTTQQLVFAGLRSVAQQGQINGVQTDSLGNLYLLLDQKDGVRLLKTDNAATQILAQAVLGGPGDVGTALARDSAGNLYVTGTTSSNSLAASSGAAISSRTANTLTSFIGKFDQNLRPLFVTYTGGTRIAATAVAATADAVFVTGITYATDLPVTGNAIQQSPTLGSSQNGFVERFSADGSTLAFATYLTGAAGDTLPGAIAADVLDNAYIAGSTSATGFPTVAALVPDILSASSGFLAKLSPSGDALTASTFIPGPGLTSLALDSTGQTLLVTGTIALNQFPIDAVASPLLPIPYQVLLRLPLDLSSVRSATVLAPGTQSFVAAAPSAAAWVDGSLSLPLLALAPLSSIGTGFSVRVSNQGGSFVIDQTARFGGLPNQNPAFASLATTLTSIVVDPAGQPLVAGSIQPTASSSLLATETYDLPLRNAPTSALPSTLRDAELSAAACSGSLCAGSAAFLAQLNPNASAPALAFSAGDLPSIMLRNLGSADATNLQLSAVGAAIISNCPPVLAAGAECNLLLAGGGAGTLTASSSNGSPQTLSFASFTPAVNTIAFYPKELDFGVQTSSDPPVTRTLTLSNLGPTSQTFTSAFGGSSSFRSSSFTEQASDCPTANPPTVKLLAAGATCHITLAFAASATPDSDGILQTQWSIGSHSVALSGYSRAAPLSLSASEIDFGTQFPGGIHLPRFLFLSNLSTSALPHALVSLPATSVFSLSDTCPASLAPASVCRIRIDYLSPVVPSSDSAQIILDQGLSVLVTGQTLPARTVIGAAANPNLSLSASAVTFATAVPLTSVSTQTQTVALTNSGTSSFVLSLVVTGDFAQTTSCGPTLAAGATCAVALNFVPTQPGTRQGLLSVAAGAGNAAVLVTLTGTGSAILPQNNGAFDFGSVTLGQPVTQFYKISQPFSSLTVAATGPYSVVLVEDAGYGHGTPASSAYAASATGACPNCFLGIQFLPTVAGAQPGTLTLSSAPTGAPSTLALTGSGSALSGLVLTPPAQDFGSVPVGSSSGPQSFTLTNLNPAGVSVSIAPPLLTGDFALAPSGIQTCGGVLASTASCSVQLAFSPTSTGPRTGTLTLVSATDSASASLTGNGASVAALAINPLALTFNNNAGPTATQQSVTLTNTGNIVAQIGTPTTASANFTASSNCGVLAPAASCVITVTFIPGGAIAQDQLSVSTLTAGQASTYTVALSGTYTAASAGLQITPASVQYGPSPVGTATLARQFDITNLTAKTLTLNVNLPRQYVLVGDPCIALAPNATCTLSVAFLPLTNGDISGTIQVQATPLDGSAVLSGLAYAEGFGTGSGALTISGAFLVNGVFNFGQVASGQILTQSFTLTNPGSAPLTVRRVSSGPPFLSTSTCGAPLASGASCTVAVSYAPTNQGQSSTPDAGTLTIESDAASTPATILFTGQPGPAGTASAATLATYTLSQNSLTFPATRVGNASPPQTVTLSNSGSVPVNLAALSTPADFAVQSVCTIIAPGTACSFTVTSTPKSIGTHIGAVELTSDSTTSLEFISLLSTATPSTLTLTPASLDFGLVPVGTPATLPLQVTNAGPTPIVFNTVLLNGNYASSGTCLSGATLAPAAGCTLQVTLTPRTTGTRPGTLSVVTSASTYPLTVPLTGIGTQSQLSATPLSLLFGTLAVGSSATLSITLQNNGTAPVTNLLPTTTGDYAVTSACGQNLAPGASCTLQVLFAPTATGSRLGAVLISSSDPGSPATIPISGTGTAGGSFTLTVDGGASSALSVASGQPANYHLTLTPLGGYTGTVALTCAPVVPAPYASCSISPASQPLAGSAQLALVTINTITGGSARLALPGRHLPLATLCLLVPGLLLLRRRRLHPLLLLALLAVLPAGCGGGKASTLLYTPPGIYQYQVTASSTSSVQVTQTVLLNLTVTAN